MSSNSYAYDLPGTVSAVFFTKNNAENAYRALLRLGHTEDDISLLMSDETLNKHANPTQGDVITDSDTAYEPSQDQSKSSAKHMLADAIISITSMISLPELGISISRKLLGRVSGVSNEAIPQKETIGSIIATKIPEAHCQTYESGMKEGGIIISVDPKNRAEKDAIIREFRLNEGHDILGDDGYTEMD
ncbi:hypothetical protein [Dyadobacter sp. CY326]|uniref:hypothetical protein n=1 Tax=Dyadobacter sp. CY326 TaxID=2907300 RepID=UPI001F17FC9D|nr:hypothetical protein [Dyadobacter sp. CY326]MCE7066175.1 hypothetical protein [Dyadobacter sp. CY326]